MTVVSRFRHFALLALALFLALLVPGVGSAWTLNAVQLDNGTCFQNLQLGSDLTASSSATPSFLLDGDGAQSSYQAWIDGTSIGTFNANVYATVCIKDSIALGQGAHTLTLKELTPTPSNAIPPFAFTVDTVPPSVPSTPVLASYSDTGVPGDNVTSLTSPTVTGTADPSVSVKVYNGALLVGGALAGSDGSWTVKTNSLAGGSYSLTVVATDEAGNQSAHSAALPLTIDTTPPSVSITSPASGAPVSGTVGLAASASDNVAVWKVAFQLDGTTLATDTTSPYSYSWNSALVANGNHTLTTIATDTAGNTSSTSETITVQNGGSVTAPSAPTLTTATPGNATVSLAWNAPSSNGGSPITSYRIYRGTSSGSETLLTTLGNTASWTDTGLTNGTTYYYKVSALNAIGESIASNELSAKPATVPSAPTLNSAAAGNGSVALAWNAPSNNGGSPITGYKVYRGTSSGGETLLTTLGNTTSWTNTGLTNGTTYYYEITALNSVGESSRSNQMSASPSTSLTAPSAPTLTSAAPGNASVALAWNAPSNNGGSPITGYKVYRGTSSGGETLLTTLGNTTSWTNTGLTNGTTYYYEITALNSVGESSRSNQMSASPSTSLTAPSAPTLTSAAPGNASVALAWNAPSNNGGSPITGYKVYRGTSSGGETLLTTLGNTTSWTNTGLTNGTTYYYKVSAVNSVGESIASNELSAKPATVPGAPTLTALGNGSGGVTLSWNVPASNGGSTITGYRIYRGSSSGGETLLTTLGNITSWTDSAVSNGTTYYYKVSAVNVVGEGARSNELSVKATGHH